MATKSVAVVGVGTDAASVQIVRAKLGRLFTRKDDTTFREIFLCLKGEEKSREVKSSPAGDLEERLMAGIFQEYERGADGLPVRDANGEKVPIVDAHGEPVYAKLRRWTEATARTIRASPGHVFTCGPETPWSRNGQSGMNAATLVEVPPADTGCDEEI